MFKVDTLTLIFIMIFTLPILIGAFTKFSREKIQFSLRSLCDGLEFILVLFVAIYLTRGIFFQHNQGIFARIYQAIPGEIRNLLVGKDILVYVIALPLIVPVLSGLIGFLTKPLYKAVLDPLANGLYKLLIRVGSGLRRLIGALAQIPRAAVLVFIAALLLNFYAYYFPSQPLTRLMRESSGYQLLYKNAVSPVLNSNLAQKIPVLVNDYFRQTPVPGSTKGRVITYFNGVTLEEAVKSDSQIDATARQVVGSTRENRQKAYLIYQWITRNVHYDERKAAALSQDPSGIKSGSIMAFNTRRGVCFDYSCLYVSMCREVGLKVRLLTGLGYSGTSWGDHAWNQVYIPEENRWLNVDATFGTVNNYFDKPDFNVDHRDAEVQGEW
jgi:hypothetical protein